MCPIQRMANVSLRPAPGDGAEHRGAHSPLSKDGFYIVGDKSWSIDMQRYNFQFTGQRFFRIKQGPPRWSGEGSHVPVAHDRFLGSPCKSVGGESTYLLGGAFNCGKGQPG